MKKRSRDKSQHTAAAEKLKVELLDDLVLMRDADLRSYWKQVPWSKPDLIELANTRLESGKPTPLAYALKLVPHEILADAGKRLDPFGSLLLAVDLAEWGQLCRDLKVPWMVRLWLAAASQLLAERRLIHRAHGWADKWEQLRRSPTSEKADDYYFARLRHAKAERRAELLRIPSLGGRLAKARQEQDGAFLRRLRRAKQEPEKRAAVTKGERFTVQHWIELPRGVPGLCFFSDSALHDLLEALGLVKATDSATKQLRVRLGLIQAGAQRHLIEEVIDLGNKLLFMGSILKRPWTYSGGPISWGGRRLWPRFN